MFCVRREDESLIEFLVRCLYFDITDNLVHGSGMSFPVPSPQMNMMNSPQAPVMSPLDISMNMTSPQQQQQQLTHSSQSNNMLAGSLPPMNVVEMRSRTPQAPVSVAPNLSPLSPPMMNVTKMKEESLSKNMGSSNSQSVVGSKDVGNVLSQGECEMHLIED